MGKGEWIQEYDKYWEFGRCYGGDCNSTTYYCFELVDNAL